MTLFRAFLLVSLFSVGFLACQNSAQESEQQAESNAEASSTEAVKIVSLSGFLTEVLFELGMGDQIVGVDITSTYPEATKDIERMGHVSNINAEAILKLQPDYIFLEETEQAPAAIQQLEDAGIKVISVPTYYGMGNTLSAIETLDEYLDVDPAIVDKIAQKIATDSTELVNMVAQSNKKPKVLFIYARGAGRVMASGQKTSMNAMIELAGGENVIQTFEGFQALTPEAIVQTPPEIIIMFTSGLASLDGISGLAQVPGLAKTPAILNERVFTMDGHLMSSFGPRSGEAAQTLATEFMK